MKVVSIVGARPNFMKIAPFVRAVRQHNQAHLDQTTEHILVHTGQHYDPEMSDAFFRQLGIPTPDFNLEVGSGSHAYQIGQTMIAFEKVLLQVKPDWVIVVGDVNATAACSLTARKHGVRVAHIEAGLRSFDWDMPEEVNRVVTDRLSNLLFTTDALADANLREEGVPASQIHRVGNIMIDTLEYERPRFQPLDADTIVRQKLLEESGRDFSLRNTPYSLLTLHRPSNVDLPETLGALCAVFEEISRELPIIFPVHPRTRARLKDFGLWQRPPAGSSVIFTQPLGYQEMLRLTMTARVVFTDSGGIQEEANVLGVPCLTLRFNTERPITLIEHGGTNRLVGNTPQRVREGFRSALAQDRRPRRPELWDGHTAERIVACLHAAQ